jgi:hypothetical protein
MLHTAISYILCPFGIFCGYFGIFFAVWYVVRKICQPWTQGCLSIDNCMNGKVMMTDFGPSAG